MILFAAAEVMEKARNLSQDRSLPAAEGFRKQPGPLPVHQGARFHGYLFRVLHAVAQIILKVPPNVGATEPDPRIPGKEIFGNPEVFLADVIKSGRRKGGGNPQGGLGHLLIDVAFFRLQGVRSSLMSTATCEGWPGAK
jgi:hypothetical protein